MTLSRVAAKEAEFNSSFESMQSSFVSKNLELRLRLSEYLSKKMNYSDRLSKLEDKFDQVDLMQNETLFRLKVVEDLLASNSTSREVAPNMGQGSESSNQPLMMDALQELRLSVKGEMKKALEELNNQGIGAKTIQALEEMKAEIKKLSLVSNVAEKGDHLT